MDPSFRQPLTLDILNLTSDNEPIPRTGRSVNHLEAALLSRGSPSLFQLNKYSMRFGEDRTRRTDDGRRG